MEKYSAQLCDAESWRLLAQTPPLPPPARGAGGPPGRRRSWRMGLAHALIAVALRCYRAGVALAAREVRRAR